MGNDLSQEQQTTLQNFNEAIVELLDVGISRSTLDANNVSLKRIRACKDQIDNLTPMLLFQLAREWNEACAFLMNTTDDHIDVKAFLEKIKEIKLILPLPGGGSIMDLYNVAASLSDEDQGQVVSCFLMTLKYVQDLDLDGAE